MLQKAGCDPELLAKANTPAVKAKLRENTAAAKAIGICGAPTYRVLQQDKAGEWQPHGGLVWGQDELNVVEDLIYGWDPEHSTAVAQPRKANHADSSAAKL